MKLGSTILGFIAAAMLAALIVLTAVGETVTLAWDPSPDPSVMRYRVYYGLNSRAYGYVTNASLVVTQTVVLPQSGRWFFAATACNSNGLESVFSNEVEWEAKPDPPAIHSEPLVRITPVLERSTNLVNWSKVRAEPTLFYATNAAEFFRASHLTIEPVNRVK